MVTETFSSPVLQLDVRDHIARLSLSNPERRNALGSDFWRDLPRAVDAIEANPDARVVVLTADGPHFTVGLDLKSMGGGVRVDGESVAQARLRSYHDIKRLQRAITAVADCRVPVIAVVHGYCIGGGIDLIAACDIRLASHDAVFSVRETKIAITADVGTLQRLPKIVGAGHVRRACLHRQRHRGDTRA